MSTFPVVETGPLERSWPGEVEEPLDQYKLAAEFCWPASQICWPNQICWPGDTERQPRSPRSVQTGQAIAAGSFLGHTKCASFPRLPSTFPPVNPI